MGGGKRGSWPNLIGFALRREVSQFEPGGGCDVREAAYPPQCQCAEGSMVKPIGGNNSGLGCRNLSGRSGGIAR